jgi:hypothetical protein
MSEERIYKKPCVLVVPESWPLLKISCGKLEVAVCENDADRDHVSSTKL